MNETYCSGSPCNAEVPATTDNMAHTASALRVSSYLCRGQCDMSALFTFTFAGCLGTVIFNLLVVYSDSPSSFVDFFFAHGILLSPDTIKVTPSLLSL